MKRCTRFGPPMTFGWVLGILGLIGLGALSVAAGACSLQTCTDKTPFRLEVAKAGLQVLVVTVIGGLVTVVTGAFKNAFDAAKADQEARGMVYGRLVQAYRQAKLLRRRLKVRLNEAPQDPLPHELMLGLESVQLDLEQLKWEVPTLESIFAERTDMMSEGLAKMEKYLRAILKQWEDNPGKPLIELPNLVSFSGDSRESFHPGIVLPYVSVRNLMRAALRMGRPDGQGA